MTYFVFKYLILAHVIAGGISLAAFWIPVFAPKGRALHKRVGKVFAYAMLFTAGAAGFAATMTLAAPLATHPEFDPRNAQGIWLLNGLMLGYLSVITFGAAYEGLRTVRLKSAYGAHREWIATGINIVGFLMALTVFINGVRYESSLMIGLSLIGILGTPANIKLAFFKPESPREWFYQHMGSMLGAGIAAHTAFLVFGMSRLAPELTNLVWVWLAPAMIGIPGTVIWTRYYRRLHAGRAINSLRPARPLARHRDELVEVGGK